jgi:hypothetical protein
VPEGYSDSNWISNVDEFYIISGYVSTFGGGASNWISDVDEFYIISGYLSTFGGGAVSWRSFTFLGGGAVS